MHHIIIQQQEQQEEEEQQQQQPNPSLLMSLLSYCICGEVNVGEVVEAVTPPPGPTGRNFDSFILGHFSEEN